MPPENTKYENQSIILQRVATIIASLVTAAILGIVGLVYDMRDSVVRTDQNVTRLIEENERQQKRMDKIANDIQENRSRIQEAQYDIDNVMRGLQQLLKDDSDDGSNAPWLRGRGGDDTDE